MAATGVAWAKRRQYYYSADSPSRCDVVGLLDSAKVRTISVPLTKTDSLLEKLGRTNRTCYGL